MQGVAHLVVQRRELRGAEQHRLRPGARRAAHILRASIGAGSSSVAAAFNGIADTSVEVIEADANADAYATHGTLARRISANCRRRQVDHKSSRRQVEIER